MASSSSEDSLLELLELLLLLIVRCPCGYGRSFSLALPKRRRVRPAAGGPSTWKIGCRLAAYVVVHAQRVVQRPSQLALTY